MVTSKNYCETAGFRNVLPSHFKPPVHNGFQSNSSAASPLAAVSHATDLKSSAAAFFTRRKDEWSGNGNILSSSDGAKYGKAIAAIPLRSLPTCHMKQKPEKSVSSHDKVHDEGQKDGKTSGNMDHKKEELWILGMDTLNATIANAKEFMSLFDPTFSMCNTFLDAIDILKNLGEPKGQHPSLNSDALTLSTSIDQSLSRKRQKVSSGISLVVQEKNACGTETMSGDKDEGSFISPAVQEENACGTETMSEDEVRILSPAVQEENACGTETISEDEVRILSPAVEEENTSGTETMSEDEDEVRILSPAEWKVSQLSVNNNNECVKPHGIIDANDYADPVSVATKAHQPVGSFPNCELTEAKCRDLPGNYFTDSGECSRESEGERYDDASKKMLPEDDDASGTYSLNCKNEHEYAENHKRLINFEIVPRDHPKGREVMEALKLFKEEYDKLLQQHESEPGVGKSTKGPHFVAAENVRLKGMNFSPDKPFGHIPGIEIGHEFSFRTELAIVGLNNQNFKGIDYVSVDWTPYATSVVDSGRYENKAKEHDILIYSGEGGNPNGLGNSSSDQKLVRGNLALFNSMEKEFPVRVIHKRTGLMKSKTLGAMPYVYVYYGLYKVNKYWQERDNQSCKLVYKFELQRLPGQPRIGVIPDDCEPLPVQRRNHGTDATGRKPVKEICVVDDVSQEKEKFKVRAMNGVDDEHPPPFTYTIKNVYPRLYWLGDPVGCDCVNGCSDSVQCPCVKKNGGEIPYNENGQLMKAKSNGVVHECGPSCKCPPTCMNRVSQGGPRLPLEIFKTKSMGWGVRSRSHILAGSFICEYVGEILSESEANQKIGKDEYLFDICHGKSQDDDYALDAANYGNIGRFINHSCDPNVFTRKVFYDHDDKKMPHIMFFASKKILPRHELMYDYNYANVEDVHGKLKSKACHCGSRKCTGRLY
ncbi:[histone H3]-lysine(4) N-trimethyltransferase [Salvia divinorum]|uniref:[histone H3]-lysine(4) N-trimethyltransferase n=1 Tax=Salvia divinorum TaxID=28513 RepID=A0ABD1HS86_SALDI